MKKTWKERLYNVSCSRFAVEHIPTLHMGLALLSIVCAFVFEILFECTLLSEILYNMFWILLIIGWSLRAFFYSVRSCNKETFCCNNTRKSLLADELFVGYVLSWVFFIVLVQVAMDIFGIDSYGFRVTFVIGCLLVVPLSNAISKPISKHFKKKIIYTENENFVEKVN